MLIATRFITEPRCPVFVFGLSMTMDLRKTDPTMRFETTRYSFPAP